jgi:hydrogenase maturation protein HypF
MIPEQNIQHQRPQRFQRPLRSEIKRIKIHIHGAVQGVGFRPFIYRLAERYGLTGWVRNNSHGVLIEADGPPEKLKAFLCAIQNEAPPQARIQSLKHVYFDSRGYSEFQILESDKGQHSSAWILPDISACPDCLEEIFDPNNRRYLYPFTNCTHCGPRFTIIESMPYDRPGTSMKFFRMCPECQSEYGNPKDRRFHAQPNACPVCGPRLEFCDREGKPLSFRQEAMEQTVRAILDGKIVAVKGLGGFHLMADATNSEAVRELRNRKRRREKPFALMFPDLDSIESVCQVADLEKRWLTSPEAPILLLWKKLNEDLEISYEVAPENPCLGAMLPYTPLHYILLKLLDRPVIATSGNLSEEPICIDNQEALDRLKQIADYFLLHNRPIIRPVDDSIGQIVAGREMILRRARGYAPLPIMLEEEIPPAIAFGGHLKNTVTIAGQNQAIISQHIGDLETESALRHFRRIRQDLQKLMDIQPVIILHDLHPDYVSTHEAQNSGLNHQPVQHHLAHILSCMLENEIEPPVLGISWDGTGFGTDGTLWGGEFIIVDSGTWKRIASLRPFPIVGGDAAIREPRRSALGMLYSIFGEKTDDSVCPNVSNAFHEAEWNNLNKMLSNKRVTTLTSSAGRLFDAVASMTGLCQINQYEGQAAMLLEYAAWQSNKTDQSYPFKSVDNIGMLHIDWEPMIRTVLEDIQSGIPAETIADRFHWTCAEIILMLARKSNQEHIVLSGGCFQNKLLTERTIHKLTDNGFKVYWHQRVPPNDGGISLGQIGALKYGIF